MSGATHAQRSMRHIGRLIRRYAKDASKPTAEKGAGVAKVSPTSAAKGKGTPLSQKAPEVGGPSVVKPPEPPAAADNTGSKGSSAIGLTVTVLAGAAAAYAYQLHKDGELDLPPLPELPEFNLPALPQLPAMPELPKLPEIPAWPSLPTMPDPNSNTKPEEAPAVKKEASPEEKPVTAPAKAALSTQPKKVSAKPPPPPIPDAPKVSETELVLKALEDKAKEGASFSEVFQAMRHQAEVDAAAFERNLQLHKEHHQAEMAGVRSELSTASELVASLQQQYEAAAAESKAALAELEAEAVADKEAALAKTKLDLEAEAAAAMEAERTNRLAKVDELRMTVNTLEEAFVAKADERKDSHTAHKVAVGAFAMEAAMQEGAAFQRELQWIAEGARGDPLVEAAVAALPASIAQSGAATRPQLYDRFSALKEEARMLALVPPGSGPVGPVTRLAARLASKLRTGEEPNLLPGGGVEATLARAQGLLAAGRLLEAAEALEEGSRQSAAAPLIAEWAQAVRSRAVAEQTLELLQAHAAAIAAGLS
mmetsp:Transcript_67/g.149  ORF Transcript_67/g.149 Transcript_67/m.149 type:complete len:538 (-) Transcript_67:265-1878(-)|eukprot:CAMPEP_0118950832 /NCGR_PEP_ID=MMETSP1169-20130426/52081_1 /TAXON_ID=36882 /ORGANISM="Pyramimonas obovata, Strain CCMP722" /LENGTH=537 /DNA_ID=CAMNT_0006897753 /DNA_START=25 /DNA_END=1638 /DNA_ORIENTATION=+